MKKAEQENKPAERKADGEKKADGDKKFKILAISDTHNDVSTILKMAEKAEKENVDLVLLCGDITYFSRETSNIIGPFLKRGRRVMFIPGNHEDDATADFLSEMYNVRNLHGDGVVYGDIGIFGCGKGNIPINMISDKEAYELLKEAYGKIKHAKKRIMVTHIHPAGSKMEFMSKIVPGSAGVRKAMDVLKPDILICGHVHEAAGLEETIGKTKVFNVAKVGKIIEV